MSGNVQQLQMSAKAQQVVTPVLVSAPPPPSSAYDHHQHHHHRRSDTDPLFPPEQEEEPSVVDVHSSSLSGFNVTTSIGHSSKASFQSSDDPPKSDLSVFCPTEIVML